MRQAERTGSWQLESNSAEAYERYLVPKFFAGWAELLTQRAEVKQGDHVLDVACGTGIVARTAAGQVGPQDRVVGLDINEGMLDVARRASEAAQPALEWRQGDVSDMPFPDASFDVAFCQQALQFFPDPVAALRSIGRVLRPEGQLALNVLRSLRYNTPYDVVAGALSRHVSDELGAMMRSPFPNWDASDLRRLLEVAGFETASIVIDIRPVRYPSIRDFLRQEVASSPLADLVRTLDEDVQNALVSDVSEGLRGYIDDEGVVFPMETHIVIARR